MAKLEQRASSSSSAHIASRDAKPAVIAAPVPQPEPHSVSPELEIIKERLFRIEERLDKGRPAIRFPNPSIDDVWERVEQVESSCSKLAEDSLAAVESVHRSLEGVEARVSNHTRSELKALDDKLHANLHDGIEKIATVLRKLVAVQKHLSGKHMMCGDSLRRSGSASPSVRISADRQKLVDELYREIEYLQGHR